MYNPQTDEQKKRMLQQMQQNEQMARYQKNKRKQQMASMPSTIGKGLNAFNNIKNGVGAIQNTMNNMNGINQGVNAIQNSMNSAGAITDAINGAKEVGSLGSALSNATSGANALSGASGAMGAMSKAAPGISAVTGGLSAANNLAQGNYLDAGLDGAKTALTLAGGPIGMAGAAAIQIAQMFKGAKEKADQEAKQKAMEEGAKSQNLSLQEQAETKNEFDNIAQNNIQQLQQQTQPTNSDLTQSMMSQVQPEQTPNLNDLMSSYINTPNTTQTPQNGLSTPMENEGMEVGGAASANGYEGTLPDIKNIQVAGGPTIPSGPTVGNDTITPEETATTDYKQGLFDRIKQGLGNGLKDAYNGYQDNLKSSLMEGDLVKNLTGNETTPSVDENGNLTGGASETKKSIMNRIGEAVGTAQRIASNPYAQGLVSTGLALRDGENLRNALTTGINWAGNKAKSDYYQKQINPDSVPSIMGNYNKDDYNATVNAEYKQRQAAAKDKLVEIQQQKADIQEALAEHRITKEEAELKLKQLDTDSKIALRTIQGNVAQLNANTNVARVGETSRHNKVTEGQNEERINIAKQNAKVNEGRLTLSQQKNIQKQQADKVKNGSHVWGTTPNGKTVLVPVSEVNNFRKNGGKI